MYQQPHRMDEFHEASEEEQSEIALAAYNRLAWYVRWMNWAHQLHFYFTGVALFLTGLTALAYYLGTDELELSDQILEISYTIGCVLAAIGSAHVCKQICTLLEEECVEYSQTVLDLNDE